MFFTFKPKPSQTIQPNSIPNTLFAPTFPSPEISFPTWDSGCSQGRVVPCKSEQKSVTQNGGGASAPGLEVERVKSLLFTLVGQNGSVVWRKTVASSERENPLWISSAEHKRADCRDVTFPGKSFLLDVLAMGVTTACGGGKNS